MEGILPIIILIVIANVVKSFKKAQKNAPAKGDAAQSASPAKRFGGELLRQLGDALGANEGAAVPGSARPTPDPLWAAPEKAKPAPAGPGSLAAEAEAWGKAASPALVEGESRQDGEGCVGGSLDHAETEGAPRPAARATDAAPLLSASRVGAEQMRRAVVMSEILRAPVALRGRPSGR